MLLYRVSNCTLDSNMALPGLVDAYNSVPQYTFRLRPTRTQKPGAFRWFHHWSGAGEQAWLLMARLKSGYLLRFPDIADFHLSADVTRIVCYPTPGTPSETIGHLLLDQVFPLLLSKSGHMVVHASAIATPAGAIAFVGSTGRGKSTLAASFALQGFPLITDDCLILDQVEGDLVATPSYPGARLWDDSIETLFRSAPTVSDVAHYTDKKRLALNDGWVHFFNGRARLRRMYFLGDNGRLVAGAPISITPLPARDAFVELVSYSYKLDIDDRDVLEREFRMLDRVAALPLFYRLVYRHDFLMLTAVRNAVLEHVFFD